MASKQTVYEEVLPGTPVMGARDFIEKWGRNSTAHALGERQASHQHFLELCDLLAVSKPTDPDNYCFEKSFVGPTGTFRYADVWKRGCFAWEYKRPGKSLVDALEQLMRYTLPLDNPPLLVVSDRDTFEIHTHFTGYPSRRIVIPASDLKDREVQALLRAVFSDPYTFRPAHDSKEVTESAAATFVSIADSLRKAGCPARQTAHFLTQCVFCYFAESIGLLQNDVFHRVVSKRSKPERLRADLTNLFETMRNGGAFGADDIPWFNGGLFNTIEVPSIPSDVIDTLAQAAALDWKAIDPSILGTLFQRGLDPSKRSQLGAFYTSPAIISRLVECTVQRPLLSEWDKHLRDINGLLSQRDLLNTQARHVGGKTAKQQNRHSRLKTEANRAGRTAQDIFNKFLERLSKFKVLDPACGSGNFLYLALKALKDVEKQAQGDAETLGLKPQFQVTGVQNVAGIEIDEYAAELARMTVWIGELQWRKQNGYGWKMNPVLENLDHIECRDALLRKTSTGTVGEAEWPAVDVVIGNPPFLGDKKMRGELGVKYVKDLREVFAGRIAGGADLVTYWFERARAEISKGRVTRAGLVATSSIRGGRNRAVLDRISTSTRIFTAWSDEPWVNEGAAVRVSLIAFGCGDEPAILDGRAVERIHSDLTAPAADVGASDSDVTKARPLMQNTLTAFNGIQKTGPFDIPGTLARQWLKLPTNVNRVHNSYVLAPYANGIDVVRRPRDMWIVDFGWSMSAQDASAFEEPFRYIRKTVKPVRDANGLEALRREWWRLWRPRPEMRAQIDALQRYLVTLEVAKHRIFTWLTPPVLPDKNLVVIARADDVTFGILQSRFHRVWSLRLGTTLEDRPRYTPSTCFETFPFPQGATPLDTRGDTRRAGNLVLPLGLGADQRDLVKRIAAAAHKLHELREAWLNPTEWVERVPEVASAGGRRFPDRIVARTGYERELAARTLTNLYNAMPDWLKFAHAELDMAVARSYGWTDYSETWNDEEILSRLLALNLSRAGQTDLDM